MSIAISVSPTSPVAASDAATVTITGLSSNDAAEYDAEVYPTEPELRYKLHAVAPSGHTPAEDLISEVFSCDADGSKVLLPLIFPVAGSWTLNLIDTADDSTAASQALTVA